MTNELIEKMYRKIRIGDLVRRTDHDVEPKIYRYGVVVGGNHQQKIVMWEDDTERLYHVLRCALVKNQCRDFEFKRYTGPVIYDEMCYGIVAHPTSIYNGNFNTWETFLKFEPNYVPKQVDNASAKMFVFTWMEGSNYEQHAMVEPISYINANNGYTHDALEIADKMEIFETLQVDTEHYFTRIK
jgi:hypothetical protein